MVHMLAERTTTIQSRLLDFPVMCSMVPYSRVASVLKRARPRVMYRYAYCMFT